MVQRFSSVTATMKAMWIFIRAESSMTWQLMKLVNGQKLRRGLKLWTVSVSTWKADLYRRLWLGRGDAEEWPPGWVHLPRAIEVEWVKQLVAEQLRTSKDKRGFARQEWAKLRDRNEALDCAVLARAAGRARYFSGVSCSNPVLARPTVRARCFSGLSCSNPVLACPTVRAQACTSCCRIRPCPAVRAQR
jgi:phage terminase large subunit GpA-like protein